MFKLLNVNNSSKSGVLISLCAAWCPAPCSLTMYPLQLFVEISQLSGGACSVTSMKNVLKDQASFVLCNVAPGVLLPIANSAPIRETCCPLAGLCGHCVQVLRPSLVI